MAPVKIVKATVVVRCSRERGFYQGYVNALPKVADVAIVAGVIGLLYDSLMASRKDAAKSL